MLNVVLVEPEIPANTGNIGRTCVVSGTHLHLVGPLGFSLDDKSLKRAGMAYWQSLNVSVYDTWDQFLEKNGLAQALCQVQRLVQKVGFSLVFHCVIEALELPLGNDNLAVLNRNHAPLLKLVDTAGNGLCAGTNLVRQLLPGQTHGKRPLNNTAVNLIAR